MPALAPEQLQQVDSWLRSVLWEKELPNQDRKPDVALEIHRVKARLVFNNGDVKFVQGVREVFEILEGEKSSSVRDNGNATSQSGKIVLIGRGLNDVDFERSFLEAIQHR